MTSKNKSITIEIDADIEHRLSEAAEQKGVTIEQFCWDAVKKELGGEAPFKKFSAEGMIAAGEAVFRGRLSVTDSADLIREAREERHGDMEGNGSCRR